MSTLEPLPPPPPRPPPAVPAERTSAKAIASMVLALVGLALGFLFVPLLFCVAAIVLGEIARREVNASGGRVAGWGQAVAGMVLGILGLAGWGATILVGILTSWL